MKKKLLGNDIAPKCEYCKYGTAAADNEHILCPKQGVLDKDFSCSKYEYDPLKRVPRLPAQNAEFSAEDFEL